MKTGRSLMDLAAELQRQSETRKDFIAAQGAVEAVLVNDNEVAIAAKQFGAPLTITPYAHGQLAQHLEIPKAYYDRMAAQQPALLTANINAWLQADAGNRRMLRTLDGKVRAVLSPKFRALDNFDLAQAVIPTLIEKRVQITSCELTETRMYIKGILPELSDELPAGLAFGTGHHNVGGNGVGPDRGKVVAAVVITNSDIGNGTLRVEPSVFTTWCTNLAVLMQAAMKKYHAGRANSADESWQVFADETRQADDAAFWLKVRDICKAAFDEKIFRDAVASIRRTAEQPITSDDLPKVVELAIEQLSLPPAFNGGILKALAAGGDLTQWGLSSAITRVANDAADYEMATLLERAGGTVLAMPEPAWKRLSAAGVAA
jgi:hypothetical protein